MPVDPNIPGPVDPRERLAERLAALERQVRGMAAYFSGGAVGQFPVVGALPPAGRGGRAVVLSTDWKLYVDNGSTWVPQT